MYVFVFIWTELSPSGRNGLLLSQSLFCGRLLQQSIREVLFLPDGIDYIVLLSQRTVSSPLSVNGIIFYFKVVVDGIIDRFAWLLSQSLFRVWCTVDFAEC